MSGILRSLGAAAAAAAGPADRLVRGPIRLVQAAVAPGGDDPSSRLEARVARLEIGMYLLLAANAPDLIERGIGLLAGGGP